MLERLNQGSPVTGLAAGSASVTKMWQTAPPTGFGSPLVVPRSTTAERSGIRP
ncbi:hypothetical protein ABZZ79_07370 [Streptomyces sp. NPDC006458]|uniref:hypothetical protein n=1 Tax=Streptomyces sp. NPDC006458 TaxID=3154302 RepID=UPI0033AE6C69